MGYYRPRPIQVQYCKHCAQPFETRHKRALYCGDSCRVLAHRARHSPEGQEATLALTKSELSFSYQNVGTTAVGAGVAALSNYLLNDHPAQQRLLAKLDQVDKNAQRRFNGLDQGMQFLIDSMSAMMAANTAMRAAYEHIQADRLLAKVKTAELPSGFMQFVDASQLKQPAKSTKGR